VLARSNNRGEGRGCETRKKVKEWGGVCCCHKNRNRGAIGTHIPQNAAQKGKNGVVSRVKDVGRSTASSLGGGVVLGGRRAEFKVFRQGMLRGGEWGSVYSRRGE